MLPFREYRTYKDFRELAPGLVRGDETEGYGFLLQLVFEELVCTQYLDILGEGTDPLPPG